MEFEFMDTDSGVVSYEELQLTPADAAIAWAIMRINDNAYLCSLAIEIHSYVTAFGWGHNLRDAFVIHDYDKAIQMICCCLNSDEYVAIPLIY